MISRYQGEGVCASTLCEESLESPSMALAMRPQLMDHSSSSCPVECAHFIYPMLDWSGRPLLALLTTLGGCVAVIVSTSVLYGLYRLRLLCSVKFNAEIKARKVSVL